MNAELEKHCKTILKVINDRDFNYQTPEAHRFRTRHISPSWSGKLPGSDPWLISFNEQTEVWQRMTTDFPGIYFELLGVDCVVHENDRTADVVMRAVMVRGSVRLMTACELKWKFSSGRWQWYYHAGMSGICPNLDGCADISWT